MKFALGSMRGASITIYYSSLPKEIQKYLAEKEDNYILSVSVDDLAEHLYKLYSLPKLEIDPERPTTYERKTRQIQYEDPFGERRTKEQNQVVVTLYFTPYRNLENSLAFEASTGLGYPLEVEYNQRNYSVTFTTTIDKWNSNIDHIKKIIENRNPEIEKGNQKLINQIPGLIEARKKKISDFEKELEEAAQQIDIPLKRLDIDEVPLVNLQVRKTIQALQRPLAQPRKEFVLDRKYVLDILEIMERSGMQFELNPEVYGVKLGEEDLRSLILAHLNTIFEGSATGETFSKGKVDIYLNIPKGQIFIAECKFWDGEKNYQDTIDQLFRYLTWRRNFAALITFSKNKNLTDVLSKVEQATTTHPTFSKEFQRLGQTHFQSTHTFPEDPKKEIEIHHLVFNLYVSK